jgi:hypothetical protein
MRGWLTPSLLYASCICSVCRNFVGACQDLRTAIKKLDKLLRRVKVRYVQLLCVVAKQQ